MAFWRSSAHPLSLQEMASYGPDSKKRRDNFSQAVLKILCRRAGGMCCKCGATTLGPVTNNPYLAISIGQGAHIAAAAPGGPRYDKRMSPEERSSATNGLWLCSNCHDHVDKDPDAYPAAKLLDMKKQHELRVRRELGIATNTVSPSNERSALITGISSATILGIRRTKCQFLESLVGRGPHTHQAMQALGDVGFIDVEGDEYLEEVGWELMLLFHQIVAHCRDPGVKLEVIRRLKPISDRYQLQWDKGRVQLLCDVVKMTMFDGSTNRQSRVFQSGVALLKDVSLYPAIRNLNLHHIPQQIIRKMREYREDVDGETNSEPETKKSHITEEHEKEQYLKLLEELLDTTDLETTLHIEKKMEELGYTPYVQ